MNKPTPRNIKFPFQEDEIPCHWLAESAVATHMANSLNLLFPKGERYFVRSVRAYLTQIKDPELREAVKAFMTQEHLHGREHERFFELLEKRGFELKRYFDWYERFAFGLIEPLVSPKVRLATTAAFEHYTAMFAEAMLQESAVIRQSPQVMNDLFRWHACEELEHKAVAFDVLQAVAPGYLLRIFGLLIATTLLSTLWITGSIMLFRQDPAVTWRRIFNDLKRGLREGHFKTYPIVRTFVSYLRPGFHPNDRSHNEPLKRTIAEIEERYVIA